MGSFLSKDWVTDSGKISVEENSGSSKRTEYLLFIPEEERIYATLIKSDVPTSQLVIKEESTNPKPPTRCSTRTATKSSPLASKKKTIVVDNEDDKSQTKSSSSPTISCDKNKSSLAPSAEDLLRRAKLSKLSSDSTQFPPIKPKAPSESAAKGQKNPRTIGLPEGFCNS